jgi:hypothetical protein
MSKPMIYGIENVTTRREEVSTENIRSQEF